MTPGFKPGGGHGLGRPPGGSPPPPPPPPSPPPPPPTGTLVTAPASINNALQNGASGETFVLRGVFNNQGMIRPKAGQKIYAHGDGAIIDGNFNYQHIFQGNNIANVWYSGLEIRNAAENGITGYVGFVVEYCHVYNCRGNGVGAGIQDLGGNIMRYCEIHDCGSTEVLGHDSGGAKFARTGFNGNQSHVHDNYIHDNIGNGLWWDVGCEDVLAEDNLIVRNTRKGLFQEKGYGPCIFRRNRVYLNGSEGNVDDGPRYGNILNASSKDCIFEDNVTYAAKNKRGLSWYDRDDAPKFYTGNVSQWHITGNISRRNKLYGGDQRECSNDSGSPNPCNSGGVVFATGADADQFFAGSPGDVPP